MNIELKNNQSLFFTNSINLYSFNSVNNKDNYDNQYQFILKMMKAGVHFGHKVKKWNPKMAPFIYQKLQGIHIIDIIQSYTFLKKSCKLLYNIAADQNYNAILFVGTRKESPIPNSILYNASRCNSFYINNKWLSGMLTNWENTRKSIKTLQYLRLYQKTNSYQKLSMKIHSLIDKKRNRLEKYFGGIQNMTEIPNLVILVGEQSEATAARECRNLKIRNVTILDTDCNPEFVDFFVPANDDSSSSLNLILGEFQLAINLGRQKFCEKLNLLTKSSDLNNILEG